MFGMANGYNNIDPIRTNQDDLDKDLKYAMESLKKNEEFKDRGGMARDYSNMGQVLKDKGDLDEALKYGKMSLKIDEELNDLFQVATDYFNLISLYYLKNDEKEELLYLKKLKELLDRVPNYSHMDYILKRIRELENTT